MSTQNAFSNWNIIIWNDKWKYCRFLSKTFVLKDQVYCDVRNDFLFLSKIKVRFDIQNSIFHDELISKLFMNVFVNYFDIVQENNDMIKDIAFIYIH